MTPAGTDGVVPAFPTVAGRTYLVTFATSDGRRFDPAALAAIGEMGGELVEASGDRAAFRVTARKDQVLTGADTVLGGQSVRLEKVEERRI